MLRFVDQQNELPPTKSADRELLLTYLIFQKQRTMNAGNMSEAMTDFMAKLMMEADEEFKDIDPEHFEIGSAYPVALPLSGVPDILPMAESLKMYLFVNLTDREFITSDDPVVAHNTFCEGITYQGVLGWNSSGLQVFWPLSPRMLLALVDMDVYRVNAIGSERSVVRISSERDVAQLNNLQIMNARHNIYFLGQTLREQTIGQCKAMTGRRPTSRSTIVETESVEQEDGTQAALMHAYEPLLPVSLSLRKIDVRKSLKRIPSEERANMYRNPIERSEEEASKYGTPPEGSFAVKRIIRK